MKTGTFGFNGSRLKEAREARGLTASALAEILNLTRAAVSLYENRNASPQPEVMERIADKLNFPVTFFLTSDDHSEGETIFYRSMASTTKLARARGRPRYRWLKRMIVPFLREFVGLPEVNMPDLGMKDFRGLSENDIEIAALSVRRTWGLGDGPISDIALLLENNGSLITKFNLCDPKMDAFSVWCPIDLTPYIVLGADKGSAVRSRFDLAHELGHFVLHKTVTMEHLVNTRDFHLLEEQASRFASAFLVPAITFSGDLYAPNLDSLLSLKNKWLVSVGMMIKRAEDIGIITCEKAQQLWVNYGHRGWRKEEPLDRKLQPETPRVLRRAFELILQSRVQTTQQVLEFIPLNQSDIEETAGLPRGFLDVSPPSVRLREEYDDQHKALILKEAEEIVKGRH